MNANWRRQGRRPRGKRRCPGIAFFLRPDASPARMPSSTGSGAPSNTPCHAPAPAGGRYGHLPPGRGVY
ncbi:MAG: hypothetical protein OXU61_08130 [Gammaproteobacteria bacterium]|nr:hypothetical protein [Gammaproteobacteria bacterium]